jgi:anti-sigma regulatory factor (Ser/Thr protein kinase)
VSFSARSANWDEEFNVRGLNRWQREANLPNPRKDSPGISLSWRLTDQPGAAAQSGKSPATCPVSLKRTGPRAFEPAARRQEEMSTGWSEQEYRRRDAAGICEHSLTIRVDNDRQKVTRVVQRLLSAVEAFDWMPPQDRLYSGVALEEAVLNAMIHGNLEVSSSLREADDDAFERLIAIRQSDWRYNGRLVTVEMSGSRERMSWRIIDEGPGFNVARLPDPRSADRINLQSGRGVLMMRAFMDEVAYNARGNEVMMTKRRKTVPSDILDVIAEAVQSEAEMAVYAAT